MGYDLARVVVIEDSPEKHGRNHGNLIRVTPFEGVPDDELAMLPDYLDWLTGQPNVRSVDKRGWQRRL